MNIIIALTKNKILNIAIIIALFGLALANIYRLSAATLELSPSNGNFPTTCSQTLDIIIDATAETSNGAEFTIFYDTTKINIVDQNVGQPGVQIQPGDAFPLTVVNNVNTGTGEISFAAVNFFGTLTTQAWLARIHFTANLAVTDADFDFDFVAVGNTTDSNVADSNTNVDLLTSVTNGSYTFFNGSCVPDVTPPNINFTSPTNGQTGFPLSNNLTLTISDAVSDINLSQTSFTLNGVLYYPTDPEVSYVGGPLSYNFTINPAANLPAGTNTLSVSTRDVAGNIQNSSITFNQPPAADAIPPVITFVSPVNGQNNVALNSNVIVKITDSNPGVDLTQTTFTVFGINYTPASPQVQYTGNANDYTFTINPTNNFPAAAIGVTVSSKDLNGNSSSGSMIFNQQITTPVVDSNKPEIIINYPANLALNIPANAVFEVVIKDDVAINIESVVFVFNGKKYTIADSNVTYTGTQKEYTFLIDPSPDVLTTAANLFEAYASDTSGGAAYAQVNFNADVDGEDPACEEPGDSEEEPPLCDVSVSDGVFGSDSPISQAIEDLGVSGILAASLGVMSLAALLPLQFLTTPIIFFRYISFYLGSKTRRRWGIVLDGYTGKPISFAQCQLLVSGSGLKLAQTVSDKNGRYGFDVGSGKYTLTVKKPSYTDYQEDIEIKNTEYFYHNVKMGTLEKRANIIINLLNTVLKGTTGFLYKIRHELFFFGFALAIVAVISNDAIFNKIVLGLYITFLTINAINYFRKLRIEDASSGVLDTQTELRVPFANVQIYDPSDGDLLDIQQTDFSGKFYWEAEPGQYVIIVNGRGYQFPSNRNSFPEVDTPYGKGIKINVTDPKTKILIYLDPSDSRSNQQKFGISPLLI